MAEVTTTTENISEGYTWRKNYRGMDENHLRTNDLKNVALAIYRERRKDYPTLPKDKADIHEAVKEHPNMFIYVDVVKKIQATTYIKIRSMDTPAAVRRWEKEKTDYLMEKHGMYLREEISRHDYIKTVAYKLCARTDL